MSRGGSNTNPSGETKPVREAEKRVQTASRQSDPNEALRTAIGRLR
jgi:hypothetical protein